MLYASAQLCNSQTAQDELSHGFTLAQAVHPLAQHAEISCISIGAAGCHRSVMSDAMAVPALAPQAAIAQWQMGTPQAVRAAI